MKLAFPCFVALLVAVEGGAAPGFERGALDDDRVSRKKDSFMEMPPLTSPALLLCPRFHHRAVCTVRLEQYSLSKLTYDHPRLPRHPPQPFQPRLAIPMSIRVGLVGLDGESGGPKLESQVRVWQRSR